MSRGSSSSSSQLSSVAGGLEHVAACDSSVSARTNSTLVIRMELGPLPTVTSEARPAGDAADGWIMTERLTGRGSPGPVASHAITSREPTGRAARRNRMTASTESGTSALPLRAPEGRRAPGSKTVAAGVRRRLPGARVSRVTRGRVRALPRRFHEAVVPRQVALQAILEVGRGAQPVRFAGIDDELGRAAEASQRLVELLAVLDRNGPIDVASHDEGGSHDPLHLVERGQPLPHRPRPPRAAQLLLPLVLIVVVAVVREVEDLAGAADRGREAVGLHDHMVGEDAAVGPAAHAEAPGVGDPRADGVVYPRHHVVVVLVAPVGPDGAGECLAIPRGAARIDRHHRVAVRRE